ncbi:hypothetical protein EST38_g6455 [Candolleomyces aberdarensis]|uniref:NAD(P)-binding protein n=1 Tax=Candolleomyces aberdarensis TaxID=2316362 RepID=A0A4Q2DI09_9AGAR|nr:hypothetical protein EST38_g6455 [Candolleomyces aberdarensis]
MPSWLITGASRGIGLSIVQDLLKDESNFVIATARNTNAEGLQELAKTYPANRLALIKLDVTKPEEIVQAAAEAEKILPKGLDYFLSNAGIGGEAGGSFEEMDLDLFLEDLKFNAVDVVKVTRAFLPLVRKSETKKILYVSSILGSVTVGGAWPVIANAYSVGKAALNMVARKWGATLKLEGITVAVLHPGWVQTDIGDGIKDWMAKYAPETPQITTKQASEGVINVAKKVTLEETTSFYNFDGNTIPW